MTMDSWQDKLRGMLQNMPAEADGTPDDNSATTPEKEPDRRKETLEIVFERKGRGGKSATIICGFLDSDARVAELASRIKKRLATGGSVSGGEILIQGDRRKDVAAFLRAEGYKVKGA